MSPITAQVARLATRRVLMTPIQQQAFRRFASTQAGAPADWGRIVRTRTSSLMIYFPGMALALGWPWIAYVLLG